MLTFRKVYLPVRLGEFTLFTLSFPMGVLNVSLESAIARQAYAEEMLAQVEPSTTGVQIKGAWVDDAPIGVQSGAGWFKYTYSTYPRYYIDLAQPYADYLKKFSSKSQYNLRRQRRQYFEKKGIEPGMVMAREPQQVEEFHRRAREISKLTYQERLLSSGLPDNPAFMAAMRELSSQHKAIGFLLPGADGKDSAYMYCIVVGNDLVCKYIGYDPAEADHSPGSTLLLMAIERLCGGQEFRYFDFEEGGAQYKKQFATDCATAGNALILRSSLGNRAKVSLHRLSTAFNSLAGSLADRLGLRAAVRKFLRRRATAA